MNSQASTVNKSRALLCSPDWSNLRSEIFRREKVGMVSTFSGALCECRRIILRMPKRVSWRIHCSIRLVEISLNSSAYRPAAIWNSLRNGCKSANTFPSFTTKLKTMQWPQRNRLFVTLRIIFIYLIVIISFLL